MRAAKQFENWKLNATYTKRELWKDIQQSVPIPEEVAVLLLERKLSFRQTLVNCNRSVFEGAKVLSSVHIYFTLLALIIHGVRLKKPLRNAHTSSKMSNRTQNNYKRRLIEVIWRVALVLIVVLFSTRFLSMHITFYVSTKKI